MSDWQPPSDDYAIREERTPWGRYAIYVVLLAAVAIGGIWLASQVVVRNPGEQAPITAVAEGDATEPEAPPLGADEAAWVAALTVEQARATCL